MAGGGKSGQKLFRSLGSAAHVLRIADATASPNSPGPQVNTLGDGSGGALPRVVVFAGHANNQLTTGNPAYSVRAYVDSE